MVCSRGIIIITIIIIIIIIIIITTITTITMTDSQKAATCSLAFSQCSSRQGAVGCVPPSRYTSPARKEYNFLQPWSLSAHSFTKLCALCPVHCALFPVHCALCKVHCALCKVHCALCNIYCTQCTVQEFIAPHSAECRMHSENAELRGPPGGKPVYRYIKGTTHCIMHKKCVECTTHCTLNW